MRPHRAILGLAAVLFLAAAARDAAERWIDATVLPPLVVETSVEMLDREGTLLRAYTVADGRWRLRTGSDAVDPDFLRMLIAYEDRRFYRHSGVDLRALARAGVQALRNGRITSGGSTLTMQTARLLEDGPTGQWAGKLRQMRVAMALERRLSKAEILTLYLNHAPYGGNIEGLRAATRAWFSKEPARLTPAEAALLVALPQAPEARRPDRHPEAARLARDMVLDRVGRRHVISADTVRSARTDPVPRRKLAFPALAPHLTDRLRAADPLAGRHDLTLDAGLQAKLERLAASAVREAGDRLSVAIVAADHRSGEILAAVGSAAYRADRRQGFVDMTVAVRSPGSTLKPLIYGMAFDEGLAHPETLIEDRPTAFGSYAPQNFDGQYRGTVRVRQALQLSLNIPAVTLTEALGPAVLLARLRQSGARPELAGEMPGLAIALGGVGVTLTELTQLYAGIARGGTAIRLHADRDGAAAGPGPEFLSRAAAWQVADILSGLPPPANAPLNGLAYKTGTSYGHRDAWAIGFDGAHVIGVWLGRPDGTPVPGAFGGELAAPILFQAFARLKPRLVPLAPPPPETLLVATADLPQPLRRFRARDALFAPAPDAPRIAFPPEGATVMAGGGLALKVRDGRPPFTWLADGRPVITGSHEREEFIDDPGAGFLHLSVIDADGQAANVSVRVERNGRF